MNVPRLIIALWFVLFWHSSVLANSHKRHEQIIQHFEDINMDLQSHYSKAFRQVDSIESLFSEQDVEMYQDYLDYFHAYEANEQGKHMKSLDLLYRSVEHFVYNKQDEWAARCLFLMGAIAEVTRLIPEAINAYDLAIHFSDDDFLKGKGYLNKALNRKRLGLVWEDDYQKGKQHLESDGTINGLLYSQMITYWFYKDSATIVADVPLLGKEFEARGEFGRAYGAYKSLAFYYESIGALDKALEWVDKAISILDEDEDGQWVLFSSAYHLKGDFLLQKGQIKQAYSMYERSLAINEEARCKEGNYNLYKSLYACDYKNGNFKNACFYLEKAFDSYNSLWGARMDRGKKMDEIFRKIKLTEAELLRIKRQSNIKMGIGSFLLALLSTLIILWFRSRKNYHEHRSKMMETDNSKLKVETGKLLARVSQHRMASKMVESQQKIEAKVKKYWQESQDFPDEIKEHYADILLQFDNTLTMLTASERRYAVLIVMGVPYKSIAKLLDVQPASVGQYRNRIRKKMGIVNTDIDLEIHLKQFLQEV